ncbi:MAG TPA: DUF6614 family protein [Verrucomicrobiae bacterium]|jgi:hypothetical protein
MIHYIVWFNLRNGVQEAEGLDIVCAFLGELCDADSIAGFRLLRNIGVAARTMMPKYQVLIEFHDDSQFQAAFRDQGARGIHAGMHGRMIAVVSDFRAELFEHVAASAKSAMTRPSLQYACEI